MKTVFEHIEHVKGKPHHVRKKVAFAAAASGTAFIAFVWFVGSLSSGSFVIKATSFADVSGLGGIEVTPSAKNSTNLAGAAAALLPANTPAHIEIIDAASSTRSVKKAEQTTLPF